MFPKLKKEICNNFFLFFLNFFEGSKMEYDIQILGFSSTIEDVPQLIGKINNVSGGSCVVQLLNADGIAGEEHILHATFQAIRAFKRDENIANDLGLEVCVRASAQRQISKALNILGLKEGFNNICAVVINCRSNIMEELESILGNRNDEVIKPDNTILKDIYNIEDVEIEASGSLTRVMMERTSLLILET